MHRALDLFPVVGGVCLMIEAAVGRRLAVAARDAGTEGPAGTPAPV